MSDSGGIMSDSCGIMSDFDVIMTDSGGIMSDDFWLGHAKLVGSYKILKIM